MQAADDTQGPGLLVGLRPDAALGNCPYNTADFRAAARETGAHSVVPAKCNRVEPEPHDAHLYKARYAMALATRHDKPARHNATTVALACLVIWVRLE